MQIQIGRKSVRFSLASDENIVQNQDGSFTAEIRTPNAGNAPGYHWYDVGTYDTERAAARALYTNRAEFSGTYGA
jgi:hypothetical protein